MKREVLFYHKSGGECPVEEFLDSLPAKTARKVVWVLNLAEDLDRIPSRYFCKLADTDGIWEFRVKLGSNIFRIFAFGTVPDHFDSWFYQKTQKTPREEIQMAESFKKDYFHRTTGR